MYSKETYQFNGVEYTMTDLTRMSHLRRETIQRRLNHGMSLEAALGFADGALPMLSKKDVGKQVHIKFTVPIPVTTEKQPVLGKEYIATNCGSTRETNLCKIFYIVQLDNGKKLITYPGEFEIISSAEP